jgi:hypothetical protein
MNEVCLNFLERYLEIENILGDIAVFKNPLSDPHVRKPVDSAKTALDVRRKWKPGEAPISNLIELLEDKGIRTGAFLLPEEVIKAELGSKRNKITYSRCNI